MRLSGSLLALHLLVVAGCYRSFELHAAPGAGAGAFARTDAGDARPPSSRDAAAASDLGAPDAGGAPFPERCTIAFDDPAAIAPLTAVPCSPGNTTCRYVVLPFPAYTGVLGDEIVDDAHGYVLFRSPSTVDGAPRTMLMRDDGTFVFSARVEGDGCTASVHARPDRFWVALADEAFPPATAAALFVGDTRAPAATLHRAPDASEVFAFADDWLTSADGIVANDAHVYPGTGVAWCAWDGACVGRSARPPAAVTATALVGDLIVLGTASGAAPSTVELSAHAGEPTPLLASPDHDVDRAAADATWLAWLEAAPDSAAYARSLHVAPFARTPADVVERALDAPDVSTLAGPTHVGGGHVAILASGELLLTWDLADGSRHALHAPPVKPFTRVLYSGRREVALVEARPGLLEVRFVEWGSF